MWLWYFWQDNTAHVYGSSPSNQRIEAWWSSCRGCCQRCIDHLSSLAEEGIFHFSNWEGLDCMRFAFMQFLTNNLQEVARQWDIHRIKGVLLYSAAVLQFCSTMPEVYKKIGGQLYRSYSHFMLTKTIDAAASKNYRIPIWCCRTMWRGFTVAKPVVVCFFLCSWREWVSEQLQLKRKLLSSTLWKSVNGDSHVMCGIYMPWWSNCCQFQEQCAQCWLDEVVHKAT